VPDGRPCCQARSHAGLEAGRIAVLAPRADTTSHDATSIVIARGLRGFADGIVSVLLPGHLVTLGLASIEIGAIVTGTLLGSAALTMLVGLAGHRLDRRRLLVAAAVLMLVTGIAFAGLTEFWPLLVVAVVGTLNPSAGDVSVFLPTEQAELAHAVPAARRTRAFAAYNVSGNVAGAIGALASAGPAIVANRLGADVALAERGGFVVYATVAIVVGVIYLGLRGSGSGAVATGAPLARSRRTVLELAALFSLDSFGGGFVVQSLLVLWLYRRFGLRVEAAAAIFFATGILGAASQWVSARLAARIGHVRTMVYTHVPANLLLVLAGIAPTAPLAVACLLLRGLLSQMDVPARQAYVMAVVPPDERTAAASVTNVPRSLAAAVPPLLTGLMFDRVGLAWPLVCAGVLKLAYDVLLLVRFGRVAPLPEVEHARPQQSGRTPT
jgi:MFS family permease